jgi:hypothetical protein
MGVSALPITIKARHSHGTVKCQSHILHSVTIAVSTVPITVQARYSQEPVQYSSTCLTATIHTSDHPQVTVKSITDTLNAPTIPPSVLQAASAPSCHFLCYVADPLEPEYLRQYSDSLRAGRSGDRIPVGARFQYLPGPVLRPTQPPLQ